MRRHLACIALALFVPAAVLAAGAPAAKSPAGAAAFAAADVTLVPPASWKRAESTSSMRVAQFVVPGKGGDGDAVVYYFGAGQGGSTDDNVARWFGQVTPDKGASAATASVRETREVGGAKVTIARARGTFDPGSMGSMQQSGPKAGYALVGLVIESPQGPVFVKITGPAATIDAAKDDLEALIQSIRVKT